MPKLTTIKAAMLLPTLAFSAIASANAQPRSVELAGRDMTCRGKLISTDKQAGDTAKIGSCRFVVDLYPGVAKAILDACRFGRPCVVRARVNDGQITHVYSATRR